MNKVFIFCVFFFKIIIWYISKDNLIYLWDTANLSKPMNKISFADPLVQLAYNPCLFIVIIVLIIRKTKFINHVAAGNK